jgi:hypothetical protein
MEWILAGFLVVHMPNEVGASRSPDPLGGPATLVGTGPTFMAGADGHACRCHVAPVSCY